MSDWTHSRNGNVAIASNVKLFTGRNDVVAKRYVFMCDSVHKEGDLPQCMLGYHPLGTKHPREGSTPPGKEAPPPLGRKHPSWKEAPPCIRSMSGRYEQLECILVMLTLTDKQTHKTPPRIQVMQSDRPTDRHIYTDHCVVL